jgi:hypothetical protein
MKYLNHAKEHKKLDECLKHTFDTINYQLEEFLQKKYDKKSERVQKRYQKIQR